MLRFLTVLAIVGLLSLGASHADAHGCGVVVHRRVVATVVPVVPVVAAVFAPIVAVPAYSASYGTDPSAALASELAKLRAEIATLKSGLSSTPAPALAPRAAAASPLLNACAGCHSGAAAKGAFKVFDGGGRAKLTPEQIGDAMQAVLSGTMPQGRKLSAEEKVQVLQELTK